RGLDRPLGRLPAVGRWPAGIPLNRHRIGILAMAGIDERQFTAFRPLNSPILRRPALPGGVAFRAQSVRHSSSWACGDLAYGMCQARRLCGFLATPSRTRTEFSGMWMHFRFEFVLGSTG